MVRWLFILGLGLLASANPTMFGAEPTRILPVVLVHGENAEKWLTCLGHDCVRIEPLVPHSADDDHDDRKMPQPPWRGILPAHAIVVCSEPDGLTTRFWSDRLQNQGPLEVLAFPASHTVHRWDHERRCLLQIHQLLVKLCPQSKTTLDQRLQIELLRRQPTIVVASPLVGR